MMPEGSPGSHGRFQGLPAGQWSADPDTGVVALTEAALARLLNPDPIDKWYILDPEPIARGQFAVVYHCRHRITGEEFAAKFSSRWRLGADCTSDIVHEIAICVMLRPTPRAVQLQDVFKTDAEFVLVME
ncbi:putative serine/threonine-protein kinase Nek4-like isoform X1 [Penaeus vannamei]|uniref:Putative serine/threonine-protein kinase Nek4-like isoform X1 n=2 Tax=Penaeus vannamei TaxID=6689 RepID=A0A3R7M1C1_PENVA|nr:putative serine/threonine-protein kinase Nek4-like isoform X1 [Penaeus vannamei]